MDYPKNYFDLKGKNAEQIVHLLADKTFLTDWCYLNPKVDTTQELCDLLVVFGDTVIIWQIKNVKFSNNFDKYRRKAIDENINQVLGAERRLININNPIHLVNPNRGKELLNPSEIKQIFRIAVSMGDGEVAFSPLEFIDNKPIHIFDRVFLEIILNELDTIKDFTSYLFEKEQLLTSGPKITILGGEEELLAYYLLNERKFVFNGTPDTIMLDQGVWKSLQDKPEYKAKKDADKVSYAWDYIITFLHTSQDKSYERIARELAEADRFERRILSQSFLEAQLEAGKTNTHFRRCIELNNKTYVFLFVNHSFDREYRKEELGCMVFIARGKYPSNKKVIGIASDRHGSPAYAYDCILLYKHDWTEADKKTMEKMQKDLNIFYKPRETKWHADEYPTV